jgi:hypothetical protein
MLIKTSRCKQGVSKIDRNEVPPKRGKKGSRQNNGDPYGRHSDQRQKNHSSQFLPSPPWKSFHQKWFKKASPSPNKNDGVNNRKPLSKKQIQ